jgi:hypothetical protein
MQKLSAALPPHRALAPPRLLAAALAVVALLAGTPAAAQNAYRSIRIAWPENGATVHDNLGRLDVAVEVEPPLDAAAGDRLVLTLDGVVAANSVLGHISLTGVPRGAHTLEAAVVNRADRVLLRATPVVVHVWQASRLFPGRAGAPPANP